MIEELINTNSFEKEENKEVQVIGDNLLKEISFLKNVIKEKEEGITLLKEDNKSLNNNYILFKEDKEREIKKYKDNLEVQKENEIYFFKRNFILEFLGILDNLEIYNIHERNKNINEIVDNFNKFLKRYEVSRYNSEGKVFDESLHNAVSIIGDSSCPSNTVVKELRSGYFMSNDVLRHSDVVVNTYDK